MKLRNGLYLMLGAVALLAGGLAGCGSGNLENQPVAGSLTEASSLTGASPEGGMKQAVTLQVLNYDGIQKLIASHRGKVVVLDCWATSCPPCVEEFPKLVAMQRRYDRDQVACISLSFDFEGLGSPGDVRESVEEFLRSHQGVILENVLNADSSDVLMKKMNLPSIPAVFVYDKQGNLQRFEGSNAYDAVPGVVEKLVKGP